MIEGLRLILLQKHRGEIEHRSTRHVRLPRLKKPKGMVLMEDEPKPSLRPHLFSPVVQAIKGIERGKRTSSQKLRRRPITRSAVLIHTLKFANEQNAGAARAEAHQYIQSNRLPLEVYQVAFPRFNNRIVLKFFDASLAYTWNNKTLDKRS